MVKTEHNKQIEIAKAYERGWNAALAQQEPVAWMHTTGTGHVYFRKKPQDKVFNPQPVYTSPKRWVGLTLNEAEDFYDKYTDRAELINAVDKFLEEKNRG